MQLIEKTAELEFSGAIANGGTEPKGSGFYDVSCTHSLGKNTEANTKRNPNKPTPPKTNNTLF